MNTDESKSAVGTGHLRSPDDYRYINLEHVAGAAPALSAFPASFHVDLSAVPDMYQRQIGACTCHAGAEHFTCRFHRLGMQYVASPRFLYALAKMNDGIADKTEQGTYPVMPFKIGVKFGVASLSTVVNDTTLDFNSYIYHSAVANIPQAAFTEADLHRIPGYVQVGGFNNVPATTLMHALMQQPTDGVSICMPVGAEWWTAASGKVSWAKSDVLPIRKMVTNVSGHDILATGFEIEANTNRIKIFFRNHWSKNWASTSGIEGGTQPHDVDGDDGWFYADQHNIEEAWMTSEIPDALLAIVKALPAKADFSHNWATDMNVGATGPDVTALQIALKITGNFPFLQPVTDYFGNVTKTAVMSFQSQYGIADEATIAAANGNLGHLTRAALNKIFAHN